MLNQTSKRGVKTRQVGETETITESKLKEISMQKREQISITTPTQAVTPKEKVRPIQKLQPKLAQKPRPAQRLRKGLTTPQPPTGGKFGIPIPGLPGGSKTETTLSLEPRGAEITREKADHSQI